jgi:hypothetical protein
MDWYLEPGEPQAVPALRRDLMAYLSRHSEPGSDLDAAELLIAEVVGNAARHTAGPVWVSLTWRDRNPVLSVYDLGQGFDPARVDGAALPRQLLPGAPASSTLNAGAGIGADAAQDPEAVDLEAVLESGRGLLIIRELAPTLESRRRTGEGMVVSMALPVTRQASADHDPPLHRSGALPMPDEALPQGGFGKESFLRALVVQLAQTIDLEHGPDAADAAVAQVGTDVGGRMEEEFRQAEGVVGEMTPEEMGRCYVRLKHAIDGGFRVLEATPERIVLVNDRCPFGSAVRQAPSLCRMTSSVFGGIAARNSELGASVLLEERIALGDPGCRVVVDLNVSKDRASPAAHHYATPLR